MRVAPSGPRLPRGSSIRRPTVVVTLGLVLSVSTFVPGSIPLPLAAQAPDLPPAARSAWTDIVDGWRADLEREGIVGASLGLVREGRLAALETHGMADLSEGRPVDAETIYHWASITKTFTAVSIMQLRDRGLLDLDDPIVEYVPELRGVHNPYGSMDEITIRQLMSHSAGFRGSTWPWAGGEDWHPHEPTEWSQLVAMIPYTEIHFEPGSRYSYSNPGIIFLGRVIEAVTGDVYEAYVDKNVFRPLGMRRSYFDVTPWHLLAHRSNHYFVRDGEPEAGGLDFNTGITVSNGGLNAPVRDMARWLGFLLGTPVGDADHDAVLSRTSLKEMWEAEVPIEDGPLGRSSMGLSFFLHDKHDTRIVGHTGTQRAFYSFFYVDPGTGAGAIAAFNTGPGDDTGPDIDGLRVKTSARIIDELFPALRQGGGR